MAGNGGRKRQGRQRRAKGGRNNPIHVRVTDEELSRLQEKAGRFGVSVPNLLVTLALHGGGGSVLERHAAYREIAALRVQLIRIGTNINQLAHWANANEGQLRPEMAPALVAAREAIQQTEAVMAALPVPPVRAPSRRPEQVAK